MHTVPTHKPSKKQVDRILRAAYINLLELKGQPQYPYPPVLGAVFNLDHMAVEEIIAFWTRRMLEIA